MIMGLSVMITKHAGGVTYYAIHVQPVHCA